METLFPTTNPVLIVAIAMVFFLVAPPLSERARLPGIIGVILAGALVGPHGLGMLERDATIELLATVGLLYLMFVAGLELDLLGFRRHRHRSLIFGILSFGIPFALALGTMALFGFPLAALLLFGAIVASHTLLAYPIADRLGVAKDAAVTAVLGGTLLTDTISLSVLAFIDAAAAGEPGPWLWLGLALRLVLYVGLVVWLLPPMGRWFFRNTSNEATTRFFFLMAVLFVSAYLAELAGAQPIIGAFLAGLTLNRLVPDQSPLMLRVRFFGSAFFVPFFLFSVGMLFDVSALFSGARVALLALALILLVVLGKASAALVSARLLGFDTSRAWLMAGLSIPQAAATLAVTFVGLEIGLFDADVVSAVVVLILVSCVAGAVLVERAGRGVALAATAAPEIPEPAPHRILVPLVNPRTAEALLDMAFLVRDPGSSEPVFPLTVVADDDQVPSRVAEAERMLARAVVHAAEADVPTNPLTRVAHNPAVGIARAARERRATDIIIGWEGRRTALPRVIFGSVIDQTLELTDQQILVCKLDRPVSTHRRMVLVLAPQVDHNRGFDQAMRTLDLIRTRLGMRLEAWAVQRHTADAASDRFAARFAEIGLEQPAQMREVRNWHALRHELQLAPSDLVVVPSARRGTVAHTAHLERLPTQLTIMGASFVILYPSARLHVEQPRHDLHELPPLLSGERVLFDLGAVPYREAVERMIDTGLEDDAERSAVAQILLEEAFGYATEVLPGILILHARVAEAKQPMLFLGISREGIEHPRSPGPAHALMILLSPMESPPQEHLARLAEAVEQLASRGDLEALAACTNLRELRAYFGG